MSSQRKKGLPKVAEKPLRSVSWDTNKPTVRIVGCSLGDMTVRAGEAGFVVSFNTDTQETVELSTLLEICGRDETTFTVTITDEAEEEE